MDKRVLVVYGRLLQLSQELKMVGTSPALDALLRTRGATSEHGLVLQVYAQELQEVLEQPELGEQVVIPQAPNDATDLLFRIVETFWGPLPHRPVSETEAALLSEAVALLKRSFGYYRS